MNTKTVVVVGCVAAVAVYFLTRKKPAAAFAAGGAGGGGSSRAVIGGRTYQFNPVAANSPDIPSNVVGTINVGGEPIMVDKYGNEVKE